jgi:hypothetical protein
MKIYKILAVVVVVVIVLGVATYTFYTKDKTEIPVNEPTASTTPVLYSNILYSNTDFGFTFSLPESWEGYSIVKSTWEGNPLTATSTKEVGNKILIRNPKWTSALPYQDIPVLVFTLAQWDSYTAENFSVSAAPIPASELGRNDTYVFALPPRWNFDFSEGYAEAESIVNSNPLKTFNLQSNVSGKINIDYVCQNALSYMSFPDGASADKFVSECKEGKHPEVVEKYKADLNLPDGAVI